MGGRRDIPSTALFHSTVIQRLERLEYRPDNTLSVQEYQPDNTLSVQPPKGIKTDNGPVERNLKELTLNARQGKGRDGRWSRSEISSNTKIQFKHHSTGSTAAHELIRAEEDDGWNDIYRVIMKD